MNALPWFLAGLALGSFAAAALLRRRRTVPSTAVPPAPTPAERTASPAPPAPAAPAPAAPAPAAPARDRTAALAHSAATELATLASGIEGSAYALVEAAANRRDVPLAAEALLGAVRRLRSLHARLGALGGLGARTNAVGTTDVLRLVARLTNELQRAHVGLELQWQPPDHLPAIAAPHEATFDALASACHALLRAEAGATRLALAAEACYDGLQPHVRIECTVEWTGEGGAATADLLDDATVAIDRDAARVLAAAHGGEATFQQLPGHAARVIVRWPAAAASAAEPAVVLPAVAPAVAPAGSDVRRRHRYGGALLLEADPGVRAMLAAELKAAGRAVFVCADAPAASTFLRATPERFEVLIVDRDERLADRELAAALRSVAPAVENVSLDAHASADLAPWPHMRRVRKPFGVHELRRALASLPAAG
ncbi:MAG: hypothetical protein ACK6D2_16065 [Planctomycetota bacterium]